MEQEIYKWLPGYEGLYQVSNFGNVLSFKQNRSGKLLKFNIHKNGYFLFGVYKDGKQKKFRLNKVVCELFNGTKPAPNYEANHIDGNKSNNRADNLEWSSPSENIRHAYKNGLTRRTWKKRTIVQKSLSGEIVATYPSMSKAVLIVGGCNAGISLACRKNINTYKGYIWDYAEVAQS